MTSSFSWLDYSDLERRRVLDVVRALGDRDTRDELGVATVRDALADLLAPGVSTIQTRARYFFFIPWIYQDLERRLGNRRTGVSKDWVAQEARRAETDLSRALTASDDAHGVIGRAAGQRLQRLPSSVYWNGMWEWGIRLCPWSVDGYHRWLATHAGQPTLKAHDPSRSPRRWREGLPKPPGDFPNSVSLQLRFEEADYLTDRILHEHPDSLLGRLVLSRQAALDVDYPWQVLELGYEPPGDVANTLRHAREFALAMQGATLIYNLMLAEAPTEPRKDWIDRYRTLVEAWADEVRASRQRFEAWDRDDFWHTVRRTRPRVPETTQNFINHWLHLFLATTHPATLADSADVRHLIQNRERRLKRAQARLSNPRRLELWNGDSGSGTARMSYRWSVMRTHLADIRRGLDQPHEEIRIA